MYHLSGRIKKIEVSFDSSVDDTAFNQNSYQNIKNNGLQLTDLHLIHCASVHYQSRFKSQLARRYRSALDTIEPAIINNNTNKFYYSGDEEPELQRQTSEVIGVGFAIALAHYIFDVRMNRINRLPLNGGRKRCDFEIIKRSKRIIVEAKGTKGSVQRAKDKILMQKQEYGNCIKYGVVSSIPRDDKPAKLHMVDPEIELEEANRDYIVISLLTHYSKIVRLAGFYRLSVKINERIAKIIESGNNTSMYQGQALDFENILKLGTSLSIQYGNSKFFAFFSPNVENGLKVYLKDNETVLIYGIEENIFNILDKQDYKELIEYSFDNVISDKHSFLDNGSFLVKKNVGEIQEVLNS